MYADYNAGWVGAAIGVYVSAAGYLVATLTDDAFTTQDTIVATVAHDDSESALITIKREGSTIYIYRGTTLIGSGAITAAAGSLTNATATYRLGLWVDGTLPLTNGSIACARLSLGTITEAQIAATNQLLKPLIAGKPAVLGGDADIAAMSFDQHTNLLHALDGTGNENVFNGIARVDYNTGTDDYIVADRGEIARG